MSNGFDIAQICLNGHIINSTAKTEPQLNREYCEMCGAKTITECKHCNTAIPGIYNSSKKPGYIPIAPSFSLPSFCTHCGKPYPWTEAKMQAAKELAEELEISDDEKNLLTMSIDDIVKDTPKTTLASTRIKKIVGKTGKQMSQAFRDLLVDIASETAKKIIWPE